jgi:hypothetical protein
MLELTLTSSYLIVDSKVKLCPNNNKYRRLFPELFKNVTKIRKGRVQEREREKGVGADFMSRNVHLWSMDIG